MYPKDIIIGDKNAILLATRVLGYGPEYDFSFYSSKTGDYINVNMDLTQVKTKDVDLSLFNNKNEFEYITPHGKNKIVFKILTHGDENDIDKEIEALKKLNKDLSSDITTRLGYMIKSVEGNTDRGFINKWVYNSFLAKDTKAFRKHVKEISPDMDLTFQFTSNISGETEALDIPFGINFFYPTA